MGKVSHSHWHGGLFNFLLLVNILIYEPEFMLEYQIPTSISLKEQARGVWPKHLTFIIHIYLSKSHTSFSLQFIKHQNCLLKNEECIGKASVKP